jgi:hypothetical protein
VSANAGESGNDRSTAHRRNYLNIATNEPIDARDAVLIVPLALLGLGLALILGAFFRIAAASLGRLNGRVVERALLCGLIFSAVGMFAPIVLFSELTALIVLAVATVMIALPGVQAVMARRQGTAIPPRG